MLPNIGIIGSDDNLLLYIEFLRRGGFSILGLFDDQPLSAYSELSQQLGYVSNRLGIPLYRENIDKFILNKELDLFILFGDPNTYTKYSRKALASGKHVLTKFILGVNFEVCSEIAKTAQYFSKNLFTAVINPLRVLPVFVHLRQLFSDGSCGQVKMIQCQVDTNSLIKNFANYWFYSTKGGGGLLNQVVTLYIDLIQFLISENVTKIISVNRTLAPQPYKLLPYLTVSSDDYVVLQLGFSDIHVSATIIANSSVVCKDDFFRHHLQIYTDKNFINVNNLSMEIISNDIESQLLFGPSKFSHISDFYSEYQNYLEYGNRSVFLMSDDNCIPDEQTTEYSTKNSPYQLNKGPIKGDNSKSDIVSLKSTLINANKSLTTTDSFLNDQQYMSDNISFGDNVNSSSFYITNKILNEKLPHKLVPVNEESNFSLENKNIIPSRKFDKNHDNSSSGMNKYNDEFIDDSKKGIFPKPLEQVEEQKNDKMHSTKDTNLKKSVDNTNKVKINISINNIDDTRNEFVKDVNSMCSNVGTSIYNHKINRSIESIGEKKIEKSNENYFNKLNKSTDSVNNFKESEFYHRKNNEGVSNSLLKPMISNNQINNHFHYDLSELNNLDLLLIKKCQLAKNNILEYSMLLFWNQMNNVFISKKQINLNFVTLHYQNFNQALYVKAIVDMALKSNTTQSWEYIRNNFTFKSETFSKESFYRIDYKFNDITLYFDLEDRLVGALDEESANKLFNHPKLRPLLISAYDIFSKNNISISSVKKKTNKSMSSVNFSNATSPKIIPFNIDTNHQT